MCQVASDSHDYTHRTIRYNMKDFLVQCVDKCKELAGPRGAKLKRVDTPYIDESLEPGPLKGPNATTDKSWKPEPRGELASVASRILMKVLYGARMARFDLLRPVSFLAQRITQWDEVCDRLLHKTM